MVHITPQAVQHIIELVAEKKESSMLGLRLSIERGGCAGLQYAMEIGLQQEGDIVIKEKGASIFIDPTSLPQLKDCTLDYEENLTGAGFRIVNPHAARSCGCGTSFEPKK